MADSSEMPDWLVMKTTSVVLAYPIGLLILGVGFWKVAVIAAIAWLAMLMDFCRSYVVGVGGLIVTLVFLKWIGINTASLSAWVHHVFY
jgi:hypothetical protein